MLFKNKKILIIGDVMVDSYLFGNVDRISPEAPVPVVDVIVKQNKLGGAANVASNIINLGGEPILCSTIGNDQKGDIFLSLLKNEKISDKYIIRSENRVTTCKTRIISSNNHQMLRVDEEIKTDLNIQDQKLFLSLVDNIINNNDIDCILFQDYDKGMLNEFSITQIIKKANMLNIPTVVDPKKKNFSFYKNVTLFKPNFKELKEGLNIQGNKRKLILEESANILHSQNIDNVFITLSENGIFVSYKNKNKFISKIIPGTPRNVADVSGAGDTVAAVASMLLNDINIEEIAKISNMAGGIVCEQVGVVPIDKEKLLKEYNEIQKIR